jgi:hypothetical protein
MIEQSFNMIDPKGQLLSGSLTQNNISVGPLPASLFEIPPSTEIKDPRIQPAKPAGR